MVKWEIQEGLYMTKKKTKKKLKAKTLKVTHAIGSSNVLWDKRFKAMTPGKRISKNGKIYWEYRINRSDIKPRNKL